MSDGSDKARQARLRQQAEHRVIVQATMQAKRAGKLPKVSRGFSDSITAIAVVIAIVATLFFALRYGN